MQVYHLCLVIWSAFESVLCTACIYGWAQLLEILESERYFSSYCETGAINSSETSRRINTSNSSKYDDDSDTSSKQDNLLMLAYTLSVFTLNKINISFKTLIIDKKSFLKTASMASVAPNSKVFIHCI